MGSQGEKTPEVEIPEVKILEVEILEAEIREVETLEVICGPVGTYDQVGAEVRDQKKAVGQVEPEDLDDAEKALDEIEEVEEAWVRWRRPWVRLEKTSG